MALLFFQLPEVSKLPILILPVLILPELRLPLAQWISPPLLLHAPFSGLTLSLLSSLTHHLLITSFSLS